MSEVELLDYEQQAADIIDASTVRISDMRPSEWAEQNIVMPKPFPGPLRYDKTPYTREIIDCLAPDHPAREIAVMGAAQFGKTATIITPAVGYIMANDPGNIIMTVGHDDLLTEAMDKIDEMLDGTGLRSLIRPTAQRAKNQKTGDTNTVKQFPNGYLKLSSASNPKIWRQASYKFGLVDDFDAVKGASKAAGNIRDLILKRFTAYATTKKILYVSSPELKQTSNILQVYKLGDQRKFMVPCPCCGEFIELLWTVEGKKGQMAGITWKDSDAGLLIEDSVGYICQVCGGFFTDQNKFDFVNRGYWRPTATPSRPDFFSYHMSALYSPHGMTSWADYVYKWKEIHPPGEQRKEEEYQTFVNLNLGDPYEQTGEAPKANELQKNIRPYDVGVIPEHLSEQDGNGKIVLLTCAADLNGVEDDARLDYEIMGWSESGSSYSVTHGSIGTFIPRENTLRNKKDRERWSYFHSKPNSVWPAFREVLNKKYQTDTGRNMAVFITGVDCGHYTNHAYDFLDKPNVSQGLVVGLKGIKDQDFRKFGIDTATFRPAKERASLYLLEVNQIKDYVSRLIKLKWDYGQDQFQPAGFMNYPTPEHGLYLFNNFFEHYEAEHRIIESKEGESVAARWVKKTSVAQNHFWDVRVYGHAVRDILVSIICKELKMKTYGWADYVDVVLGRANSK